MALVQDTCIYGVQLINTSKIDVTNDVIEKKMEMIMAGTSSIQIVQGSDAEEVIDVFTDIGKNLQGFFFGQWGNFSSSLADIKDKSVFFIEVWKTWISFSNIISFKFSDALKNAIWNSFTKVGKMTHRNFVHC